MSAERFEKVIRAYLNRSRELAALIPGDPRRTQVCADLDAAGLSLEDELEVYLDRAARRDSVHTILVAVDKSEPSTWAVDEAIRLAEGLDARISLVHAVDLAVAPTGEFAFDEVDLLSSLADRGKKLLDALMERIPADLRGQQLIREGKAEKEVVDAARTIKANLIIIGTHGRGPIGRFLLGSVAESVVRHASCPVLTVGHARETSVPDPYPIKVPESEVAGTKSV